MSCELAFCPMPHTAPPAKPAPASATSFRQSAGTSFTLGALCMSTNWTSRYSMASVCNCVASEVRVTVSPYSGARGFLGYVALSVYNRPVVTTQAGNAMCGIVGYLDKRAKQDSPVGKVVLCMLDALSCRGPDSAGVAIFWEPSEWEIRLSVPCRRPLHGKEGHAGAWVPVWPPPVTMQGDGSIKTRGTETDPIVLALQSIGVAPHRHY